MKRIVKKVKTVIIAGLSKMKDIGKNRNKKIRLLKGFDKKKKAEKRKQREKLYKTISSCLEFCRQSAGGNFEKLMRKTVRQLILEIGKNSAENEIVSLAYMKTYIHFGKLDMPGNADDNTLKDQASQNVTKWLEDYQKKKRSK